jgi:eukaryotic-like serine/threonine-protein kinase
MLLKTMKILKLLVLSFLSILYLNCASEIHLKMPLREKRNDWLNYSGGPDRTNCSKFKLELPVQMVWEYSGSAGISDFQPVIVDSVMFIGFLNGELHAIRMRDGKKLGQISLESSVIGNSIIDHNTLYVPTSLANNAFKAYDILAGKYIWKKKISGIETSPILIGKNIYVATLSGEIHCIDKNNSNTIWQFTVPTSIHSSLAVDSNIIVFGGDDGFLYAINVLDGKFIWKYYTGGAIFSTPAIYKEKVYFGSNDGKFYCLDLKKGVSIWTFEAAAPVKSGCAIVDSMVFFGGLNGKLFSINAETGVLNWSFTSGSVINTSPLISGDYVLFSSYDKKMYILDKISGLKIWENEVDGRIRTSPIVWNDMILICYEDYNIIAFKTIK